MHVAALVAQQQEVSVAQPAQQLRDILAVRQIDIDRAVVHGAFVSVRPYIDMLLRDAVGWPVFVASVVGLVWALVSDWRRGLLLVTFPLLFFAFCANTVPMTRYLNAMLPSVALAAAFTLTALTRRLRVAPATTAVLAVAVAVPGIYGAIGTDLFLRQDDTRTLARKYIERHVPAGTSFLVQPYSVPLTQSRDALVEALTAKLGSPDRASIKFQLQLRADRSSSPTYRMIYLGDGGEDPDKIYVSPRMFADGRGLAPLAPFGIDYVILKRSNSDSPATKSVAAVLAAQARLVAQFTPFRAGVPPTVRARVGPFMHNTAARIVPELERPGPIIEIWQIDRRDHSPTMPSSSAAW